MTYTELSMTKTFSFEVNSIIDDIVSNARWGFTKKAFVKATVTAYDVTKIVNACFHYSVNVPDSVSAAMNRMDAIK